MTFLILFTASFVFVAFKSFQQLNVVKKKYWWIVPVSLIMAFCGVLEIAMVSDLGLGMHTVLPLGVGGGLGSITATHLHGKYFHD